MTEKETYVRFSSYGEQSSLFQDYGQAFQDAFNRYQAQIRSLKLSTGINYMADTDIEGVTVPGRTKPSYPKSNDNPPDPGSGNGGQCGAYLQCDYMDGSGGGGGGGAGDDSSDMVTFIKPKYYISNLKEYLSVLDRNKPATLKIFAEKVQIISDNGNVGHAFISISQGGKTVTFGFYPNNPDGKLSKSLSSPGIMGDNSGSAYTHTKDYGYITSNSLGKIIDTALSYDQMRYDLMGNNCSSFVSDVQDIIYEKSGLSGMKNPDYIIYRMGGEISKNSGTGPDTQRN